MKRPPLTDLAIRAVTDLKAVDVKVLNVAALTTIADWMVICTGTSNRHVKAIADNVIEEAKKAGFRPRGIEGTQTSEWVLVDLGDVIVHAMQAQARAFYQLEKLWDMREVEAARPEKEKKKAAKKAARKADKKGVKGVKAAAKPRKKPQKPRF